MTAAIYYHPEAYTTSGPRLMGRHAAGESFLEGFLAHSKASEFSIVVDNPKFSETFEQTLSSYGRTGTVNTISKNNLAALKQSGVVYFPAPGIGRFAHHRSAFGHKEWSLCGITHTTSSAAIMDEITGFITSPIQPWDAIICTSTTVKNNVQRLLEIQIDYLKDRLGISKMPLPQLPVIPLGIPSKKFIFSKEQRSAARSTLNADENTLIVLFIGRLSFHAKAHPLAMYQALSAAAERTSKQVILVECGWHANKAIENAYKDAAALACPNIRTLTLDGRKASDRQTAWASADIFCSLSDNIQETFGLTPIEAMAAGLPVVVSDWDGYKDTIRNGVEGWLIPTMMPEAGTGGELALRHALEIDSYDMYCGHTCSLISVDIEAAADCLFKLFESPDLRRRMGEAGRTRAQQIYDWGKIIPQYEDLWDHQTEMRNKSKLTEPTTPAPWPARTDPFDIFSSYPTRSLGPNTVLALVDSDPETAIRRTTSFRQLAMVNFADTILPKEEDVAIILNCASKAPQTALELASFIPEDRRQTAIFSLAWLAKLGVIKAVN